MEILSLYPAVKGTIWGGRKLHNEFGFPLDPAFGNVAEAWLLSCHKDGPCKILNGALRGKTLAEALAGADETVLGTHNAGKPDFPVLIKLIDAQQKLSVQVHPDDDYARRVEGENGKTEAWYVLSADPGAQLVYGLNQTVSKEAFSTAIENGSLSALLNTVPVQAGDVAFIPSRTLHGIGAGIFLAEVQQSSNTTYRVYDYDRRDKAGNKRELHVKKATDVVDLSETKADFSAEGAPVSLPGGTRTQLKTCAYFSMAHLEIDGAMQGAADETSFVSLVVLEGSGTLEGGGQKLRLYKGASLFIPANTGSYTITGAMRVLETRT